MTTFLKIFALIMTQTPEVAKLIVAIISAVHAAPQEHKDAVTSAASAVTTQSS